MEEIRHRAIEFFWSLFAAVILLQVIQWCLGMCDWHIAYPWNRIGIIAITILFWAPWRNSNLPKNQGNNDLFPGQ